MRPKVVTLGGGHGQAAVLSALRQLDCEVCALTTIADDGGCSGKLRAELGMPPPGDLRRCLSALAADRALAERFEARLSGPGREGRCAGNLALAAEYVEQGSLQKAVDWAAGVLGCNGRVMPVAETPGVLVVYDRKRGRVEGESRVEHEDLSPMVAAIDGPSAPNPAAAQAIADADLILLGPGSFFTSTLSAIATADIARALCEARATTALLLNLRDEGKQTAGFSDEDYIRILEDHLTIGSLGDHGELVAVKHQNGATGGRRLATGQRLIWAPLAEPGAAVHSPERLALALQQHFELPRAPEGPVRGPGEAGEAVRDFEVRLERGLRLIGVR